MIPLLDEVHSLSTLSVALVLLNLLLLSIFFFVLNKKLKGLSERVQGLEDEGAELKRGQTLILKGSSSSGGAQEIFVRGESKPRGEDPRLEEIRKVLREIESQAQLSHHPASKARKESK